MQVNFNLRPSSRKSLFRNSRCIASSNHLKAAYDSEKLVSFLV